MSADVQTIRRRWAAAGAAAATVFVAVTAFVLAYGGSKGAAMDAGMTDRAASWYPLCIEGVIVVASIGTMIIPKVGRARFLPWTVLLAFTGLSAALNVTHAIEHPGAKWWSPLVAAVPPLALPLCVRLAERVAIAVAPAPPAANVIADLRAEMDRVTRSALTAAGGAAEVAERTADMLRADFRSELSSLREEIPAPVVVPVPEVTRQDLEQRLATAVDEAVRTARTAAVETARAVAAEHRPTGTPRPPRTGSPTGTATGTRTGPATGTKRDRAVAAYRSALDRGTKPEEIDGPALAKLVEGPDARDGSGYYRGIVRDLRAEAQDAKVLHLNGSRP